MNLSNERKVKVCFEGRHLKSLAVPEFMLGCTKFISIAKLKTHDAEKMSCVLKNEFGLITERFGRSKYHPYLSEVLADLNDLYRADLYIVDADWALEGKGPSEGEPRKVGVILCGKDPVATDIVAAKLMGFNPLSVPHIKYCMKNLSGVKDINEVKTVGDEIKIKPFKSIPFPYYFSLRANFALIRLATNYNKKVAKFFGIAA